MNVAFSPDGGICCYTRWGEKDLSFDIDSLEYWEVENQSVRLHIFNQPSDIILDESESRSFQEIFSIPDPHYVTLGCVQAGNHYFNLLRISSYVFDRGLVAVFFQSESTPLVLNPTESKLFVSAMNGRQYTYVTATTLHKGN